MIIDILCLVWLIWFVIGMIVEMVLFLVVDGFRKVDRKLLWVKLLELLMLFMICVFIMCVELMLLQMFILIMLFMLMQFRWCISFGWLEIFCVCMMMCLWQKLMFFLNVLLVCGFSVKLVYEVQFSMLLCSRLSMLFWIILVNVVRLWKLFLVRLVSMVLGMLFMFDCSGSRFGGRWFFFILCLRNLIRCEVICLLVVLIGLNGLLWFGLLVCIMVMILFGLQCSVVLLMWLLVFISGIGLWCGGSVVLQQMLCMLLMLVGCYLLILMIIFLVRFSQVLLLLIEVEGISELFLWMVEILMMVVLILLQKLNYMCWVMWLRWMLM